MTLSIIIVSWNTRELLNQCIASIFQFAPPAQDPFEIIVIDNHSHDGTAEMVEKIFQAEIARAQLTLIKNSTNRGFARAVNQGIDIAKGEHILLQNPDTRFVDNALSTMLHLMRENSDIAILGPKITHADGSLQESCRRFPTLASQIWILLKLHQFVRPQSVARYLMKDFSYNQFAPVDQVMGACFLIRRTTVDRVGRFDEGFFIWFEEVDFCKRARNAGLKTYFTPDAQVLHHKGKSFEQVVSIKKQYRLNNSLLHYFKKHQPIALPVLLALYPINMFLALIASIFHLTSRNRNL